MKYIILVFILIPAILNAQQLDTFVESTHNGSVTYLDVEFTDENDLIISGWHRDSGEGIIWKYDSDGELIDSLVMNENEVQSGYLLKKKGDSILCFGIDVIEEVKYLSIRCFDKDLRLLCTQYTEIGNHGIIRKFRVHRLGTRFYVFINHSVGISWFKLDQDFNTLQSDFNFNYDMSGYEPIEYLDTGFVFPAMTSHLIIDTTFNHDGYAVFPYCDTLKTPAFGGALSFGESGYWYCGVSGVNDHYAMIHFSENYAQVVTYPSQGSYNQNSHYAHLRSIASNKDSTVIYSAGLMTDDYPHWVPFGSDSAYAFWVTRMDPDTLIWQKYYSDDYYYYPINMEVGPDDALYLACTRYDVKNQPGWSESVVLRINQDGIIGGTVGLVDNDDVINSNEIKVYPNPGTNYLNIEIPEVSVAKLYVYNLQGKMVQKGSFRKKYRLNTSAMPTGIYIYKIVSNSGNVYSGKWIKK